MYSFTQQILIAHVLGADSGSGARIQERTSRKRRGPCGTLMPFGEEKSTGEQMTKLPSEMDETINRYVGKVSGESF